MRRLMLVGGVISALTMPSAALAAPEFAGDPSPEGQRATVIYTVRARVSSHRLQARFGDLGRISVRFKPRGRVYRTLAETLNLFGLPTAAGFGPY